MGQRGVEPRTSRLSGKPPGGPSRRFSHSYAVSGLCAADLQGPYFRLSPARGAQTAHTGLRPGSSDVHDRRDAELKVQASHPHFEPPAAEPQGEGVVLLGDGAVWLSSEAGGPNRPPQIARLPCSLPARRAAGRRRAERRRLAATRLIQLFGPRPGPPPMGSCQSARDRLPSASRILHSAPSRLTPAPELSSNRSPSRGFARGQVSSPARAAQWKCVCACR
jgi:hypothetical protein